MAAFLPFRCCDSRWEGEEPIISEWGMAVPGQVRLFLSQSMENLRCDIFLRVLNFPYFSLPQNGSVWLEKGV
jgi:hypothetical protein